ncbi:MULTISPECIES: type I toxin-antitoxin system Ibs family toxin, partial [Enterobacteriaceae]|nr:type I toxin-antitoxin system Ibs family toxin [Salmonella enterica subsp. enterica serovar Weltevreden]
FVIILVVLLLLSFPTY